MERREKGVNNEGEVISERDGGKGKKRREESKSMVRVEHGTS